MNHGDAADLRAELNALDYVRGPNDDAGSGQLFRLVRVNQPGYLDGEPFYEVIATIVSGGDSWHLPADVLEAVVDRGCYVRVDGDEVHVRDMEVGDAD